MKGISPQTQEKLRAILAGSIAKKDSQPAEEIAKLLSAEIKRDTSARIVASLLDGSIHKEDGASKVARDPATRIRRALMSLDVYIQMLLARANDDQKDEICRILRDSIGRKSLDVLASQAAYLGCLATAEPITPDLSQPRADLPEVCVGLADRLREDLKDLDQYVRAYESADCP